MSAHPFDLVVEPRVLEGIELIPEQAGTLAGLIETEVRRIIDGGRLASTRTVTGVDVQAVALAEPPDLTAFARALAERIADQALSGVTGHG